MIYNYFIFNYVLDVPLEIKEKYLSIRLKNERYLQFQNGSFVVYYEVNEWEGNIVNKTVVKISYIEGDRGDVNGLIKFIKELTFQLYDEFKNPYIYTEVPAEDNVLLQILGINKYRLVETRLVHYNNNLKKSIEDLELVKLGNRSMSEKYGNISLEMRNDYDRYHSDIFIGNEIADNYLKMYGKACFEGYVDEVIIPNQDRGMSNSFIALNHGINEGIIDTKISQIVLTVVDSETNKGWYRKLIKGAIQRSILNESEILINTTQSTNKPVIHVLESSGFKLGRVSYIFANSVV